MPTVPFRSIALDRLHSSLVQVIPLHPQVEYIRFQTMTLVSVGVSVSVGGPSTAGSRTRTHKSWGTSELRSGLSSLKLPQIKQQVSCLVSVFCLLLLLPHQIDAWTQPPFLPLQYSSLLPSSTTQLLSAVDSSRDDSDDKRSDQNIASSTKTKTTTGDNSAMAFLRKIGRVGGPPIDFTNAVGADEGSGASESVGHHTGNSHIRKSKAAYKSCVDSGTIDDLSEIFPLTSSGTQWAGITDGVMGGTSSGTLTRENNFGGCSDGRPCNVLRAQVRLLDGHQDKAGFVQMATDLALDPTACTTVDASRYEGVELDVCYYDGDSERQSFNVHLKNANCLRQFSSYRASFDLMKGKWTTVRLPWKLFVGFGLGAMENAFDPSSLRRIGIVAIGKAMDVTLALSSIRFVRNLDD